MDARSIHQAGALIAGLRTGAAPLDSLPLECRPQTLDDAHAIQEAAIAALGEPVAGWKTSADAQGAVMRGAILATCVWDTPARIKAALMPLLGVEVEVSFRFLRDLSPRDQPYTRDEVESAVQAVMAVEIVDSRFAQYSEAPPLDRTADFMSNGGFVRGAAPADWRRLDLTSIDAALLVDGAVVIEGLRPHPAGHPIVPAVALVNMLRSLGGVKAGQFITTGTYTGMNRVKPGQHVEARLAGFGTIAVTFEA
jgi:2-keto-4-pentenoate hydratase